MIKMLLNVTEHLLNYLFLFFCMLASFYFFILFSSSFNHSSLSSLFFSNNITCSQSSSSPHTGQTSVILIYLYFWFYFHNHLCLLHTLSYLACSQKIHLLLPYQLIRIFTIFMLHALYTMMIAILPFNNFWCIFL